MKKNSKVSPEKNTVSYNRKTKAGKSKDRKTKENKVQNRKTKQHRQSKTSDSKKGRKIKVFGKATSSIRVKLIGAFIVPVILILILGIVSYNASANALQNSFKSSAQSTIDKTADYYDLMFMNIKSMSADLINNKAMQQYYSGYYAADRIEERNNYNTISSEMSATAINNKSIAGIFVIGEYGDNMYTNSTKFETEKGYNELAASEEGKLIDSKKTVWLSSRSYVDTMISDNYAISLGRQLLGSSFNKLGYMFIDIDREYATLPLQEIDMGADAMIALVIPDGGEIVSSNYKEIEQGKTYIADQQFYQDALDAESETDARFVHYDGKSQLFIYSKTPDGFMVCALIPRSEIVSQASMIRTISFIAVIIAIIVAVLIGGVLALNIGNSVKVLMKKLEKAATGDLSVNMNIKGRDEFSTLSKSAVSMIGNFKNLISQTKGVSDTVAASSLTVSDSAKQLLNDSKEIKKAISEIEKGVVRQAEDAEDCLRQMDELADKINIVSDNSSTIARIAEETNEIVEVGMSSIEQLKDSARSTVDITSRVIVEIENLGKATGSIESIIAVINEIAEQTNLLSLNASIEAARAGEAGKGFAVVADEIRKLAEQSVDSANQIRVIIDDINEKTEETVGIAKRAEDVVEVQEKNLQNANKVFVDIHNQFADLLHNLGNITGQIEGIVDSKTVTIDAIQNISAVSEQTAAASGQVTETAGRQLQSVEKLNQASEDLISHSNNLAEAIDRFKID